MADKLRLRSSASSDASAASDRPYIYSPPMEAQHGTNGQTKARPRWKLVLMLVALIALTNLVLDCSRIALFNGTPSFFRTSSTLNQLGEIFPQPDEFCDICDCRQKPPTLRKSEFINPPFRRSLLPQYLKTHILNIQCQHVYAEKYAALAMVRHTTEEPRRTLAWDVSRLRENLPTAFMFTKTSPAGKTGPQRGGYMQRHVETIREHERIIEARGKWFDGASATSRQHLWIIVEDMHEIDEELVMVLTQSKLNFIYFAFGPTRNYGNGQHNAAFSMIHALTSSTSGILKHGPVVGVDDDAEIHPDLLQIIWKVNKVGVWPMGNLGPTGWEGPVFDDNGVIKEWPAANTYRKYPIDNGAFAINSSILGTHLLPGPALWPTDLNGGESEFMDRIVKGRQELEMLCRNCHVAWHNHPLGVPHIDDMTYESGGPSFD